MSVRPHARVVLILLFGVTTNAEAQLSKATPSLTQSVAKTTAQSPTESQSLVSRQISAPCELIYERATKYLWDHGFYAYGGRRAENEDFVVDLGNRVDQGKRINAITPSGKPLSLNRFSIHKYTLPRHLSPLKAYDIRLDGHLRLAKATDGSCQATLGFEISAYEWVWALAVIDDGYRSRFVSNGTLERLYIDAIGDFSQALTQDERKETAADGMSYRPGSVDDKTTRPQPKEWVELGGQ